MQDIDYLAWILSSDFMKDGAEALTMVEEPDLEHDEQRVIVKNRVGAISDMKLYCFNTQETNVKKLFPFFNQSKDEPKAPKGLNSFCDYILLVQHIDGLFVFFLEMKRGRHDGADAQLYAACDFFDFVLQSAERIKEENGCSDFDASRVKFRKIVLIDAPSNKRVTKNKDIEGLDLNSVILHNCQNEFCPIYYCL